MKQIEVNRRLTRVWKREVIRKGFAGYWKERADITKTLKNDLK